MSEPSKRGYSIIVRNLPNGFNEEQLNQLFSPCGRIISTKVLPPKPLFEGECGFVNFADAESCQQAVEQLDRCSMNGFIIDPRPGNNTFDRSPSGYRTTSATNPNFDDSNGVSSPGTAARFNAFRPANEHPSSSTPSKSMFSNNSQSNRNDAERVSNTPKPIQNSSTPIQQLQTTATSKNSFENGTSMTYPLANIQQHEPFEKDKTYSVYLSNLEIPHVVFAATLDDYVNATLLITQMNKHEQIVKNPANSHKTKGNIGWCDAMLQIRPLPNDYYKDPVLCAKCILDGVPSVEKLSEQQSSAILKILVLDVKLEMTVIRFENNIPYVRLNLGEKNLNNEIRALLNASTVVKSDPVMQFDTYQPEVDLAGSHYVQLTSVDADPECFHVLLMRDCLPTIMNTLKDWNANKQPLVGQPKSDTLVCAQYDVDDLWYRAWIRKVTNNGAYVYFVDFGNEEHVSNDRLSECPDVLKSIPWQSVQVKLVNINLTDNERYALLRDFETERLEMKISQKNQNIYLVELFNNGKSLSDYVANLRKQQPPLPQTVVASKITTENTSQISLENSRPILQPIQSTPDTLKQFNGNATPVDVIKRPLFSSSPGATSGRILLPATDQTNGATSNELLSTLISEQRRQNHLLEQVIAAINSTNALLTQLVQR
ncbi:unnamed protein product [Adineta ricciae]|uniref:Uncharacterized protein n=1 Tax=Adineta ricciae TaxID=249248 RepID=A0A813PJH0_ADIRI|nr:unnamed protein product [Adineta ricciae]